MRRNVHLKKSKKVIVGYLGPEGSFTHEAALKAEANEYVAFSTIPQLFAALREVKVDKIVAPFENSIEGVVAPTIDELIGAVGYPYVGQMIVLKIQQNLLYVGSREEIKKVISHPQALAQCATNIEKMGLKTEISTSTSDAIIRVLTEFDPAVAAIGSIEAINRYKPEGKNVGIIEGFQDLPDNATRFAVIYYPGYHESYRFVPDELETGSESSYECIMTFRLENKAGELLKILSLFSLWGINMTKIITRPSKANNPPRSIIRQKAETNGKSAEEQFADDSFLVIVQETKENSKDITKISEMLHGLVKYFQVRGTYSTKAY